MHFVSTVLRFVIQDRTVSRSRQGGRQGGYTTYREAIAVVDGSALNRGSYREIPDVGFLKYCFY